MFFIVYQTKNKINGKIYVGFHQTEDINDDYIGSGKLLGYAIKKYGRENFERTILHVFDNLEDARQKEAEIVNEDFLKREDVYNLNVGGFGSSYYNVSNGNCHTKEANTKRSKKMTLHWETRDRERKELSDRMKANNPSLLPHVYEANKAKFMENPMNKGKFGSDHPTYRKVTCFCLYEKKWMKVDQDEFRNSNTLVAKNTKIKVEIDGFTFYNMDIAAEYVWSTRDLLNEPKANFFVDNRYAIENNRRISRKKTSSVANYAGQAWDCLGITIKEYDYETEDLTGVNVYGH